MSIIINLNLTVYSTDPFKMLEGWKDEGIGIKYWPMLTYPDIFNYLSFYPSELGSKDLCDYKNCKAYSYYKSGWLNPLCYSSCALDQKISGLVFVSPDIPALKYGRSMEDTNGP